MSIWILVHGWTIPGLQVGDGFDGSDLDSVDYDVGKKLKIFVTVNPRNGQRVFEGAAFRKLRQLATPDLDGVALGVWWLAMKGF